MKNEGEYFGKSKSGQLCIELLKVDFFSKI